MGMRCGENAHRTLTFRIGKKQLWNEVWREKKKKSAIVREGFGSKWWQRPLQLLLSNFVEQINASNFSKRERKRGSNRGGCSRRKRNCYVRIVCPSTGPNGEGGGGSRTMAQEKGVAQEQMVMQGDRIPF
ncbi:hypothetical protein CEXT_472811 [Caerostris extrusa]|uniref:Uncharacterized protein n=1 Tax=Caerostris extrusa TaxID=172846 RepID=A0AAV4XB46_CAEEX|nr:hypothetical protein CEXT_472811 [Caerostris extrusa]